jgi:predicted acyl esterase
MTALPWKGWWEHFRDMKTQEFAEFLRGVAQQVELHRYPKSHRVPKKPKPKRRYSKEHPHVSTARLLDERKAKKQRASK